MVLFQNAKPKITKPKIPKVKKILTKIGIFVNNQVQNSGRPQTETFEN